MPASASTARCLETFCCEARERLGELADRGLAFAQAVEQPDPHRLAEHAEAAGDQLDQIVRKRVGQGHYLSLRNKRISCRVV